METAHASEAVLQLLVVVPAECGGDVVCVQCGRLAGIPDVAAADGGQIFAGIIWHAHALLM